MRQRKEAREFSYNSANQEGKILRFLLLDSCLCFSTEKVKCVCLSLCRLNGSKVVSLAISHHHFLLLYKTLELTCIFQLQLTSLSFLLHHIILPLLNLLIALRIALLSLLSKSYFFDLHIKHIGLCHSPLYIHSSHSI